MAIDLADLIPTLEREITSPGSVSIVSEDESLGRLSDSFWEAKLFGFFENYTEGDGLITPITGTDELSRDWQTLIVLFAGIRGIRLTLMGTNTTFRAKAGPVEFETQNASNVMTTTLKQLQDKIDFLLANLAGSISATQTYYINGLCARNLSYGSGEEAWWGSN